MSEYETTTLPGLKEFEDRGQLCWVGLVDYKGLGQQKIILHEATVCEGIGGAASFCYGAGKCWIIDPENVTRVRDSAPTDPDNQPKPLVDPVDNSKS